jgi:hypothetical protein
VSDFLFEPGAGFGEESFWDEGLELFPASLADDLVPAILRRGYSYRKVIGRYKSENRLSLDESGRIGDQPPICKPRDAGTLRHNPRNARKHRPGHHHRAKYLPWHRAT